mmetsp:Transcript_11045/g.22630  ORF Transcript_11045/g.22630 Transcript_11045/m.22630 type:complete len:298 (-) Transcript_11045:211-1104(-)
MLFAIQGIGPKFSQTFGRNARSFYQVHTRLVGKVIGISLWSTTRVQTTIGRGSLLSYIIHTPRILRNVRFGIHEHVPNVGMPFPNGIGRVPKGTRDNGSKVSFGSCVQFCLHSATKFFLTPRMLRRVDGGGAPGPFVIACHQRIIVARSIKEVVFFAQKFKCFSVAGIMKLFAFFQFQDLVFFGWLKALGMILARTRMACFLRRKLGSHGVDSLSNVFIKFFHRHHVFVPQEAGIETVQGRCQISVQRFPTTTKRSSILFFFQGLKDSSLCIHNGLLCISTGFLSISSIQQDEAQCN